MTTAPAARTLAERFQRGLAMGADAPAVLVGDTVVTFAELHEQALRWAGALCASGAPRRVGVLAGKGVESYVALLAAQYAGATAVPLHPSFPPARTLTMARAAELDAVLVEPGAAGHTGALAESVPRVLVLTRDEPPGEPLPAPHPTDPDGDALLLFTSGSTGTPKGVRVRQSSLAHYLEHVGRRYDLRPADRVSHTFDLTFDCSMYDLFGAWQAGACVVAVDPDAFLALPAFVARTGLTVWSSTPSVIGLVRAAGGLAPDALAGVRVSLFVGEALNHDDAHDWYRATGGALLENIYGPTELTLTVSEYTFEPGRSARMAINGVVPIGTVYPGHDWLLLDEAGAVTATEGELCIDGPQRTPGYLDPAHDEGRFLVHDGQVYYRTGDRVRVIDAATGDLGYLGRNDSQVQLGGVRVELAEIEHHLRACPGVANAIVLVGDDKLTAFYTGQQQAPRTLVSALRAVLPEVMVPRRFQFLESLPLNANRKVDRVSLRTSLGAL